MQSNGHSMDSCWTNSGIPSSTNASGAEEYAPKCCRGGGGFRYVVLLVAVLCLTCICSNMIAFNFTVILMQRPNWQNLSLPANDSSWAIQQSGGDHQEQSPAAAVVLNATHVIPAQVPYSAEEKALLFNSVGISSILSTFVFSALYTKFGARYVFFCAGVISTLSTGLLPPAASAGMVAFVGVRFLQGFAYGANFAAIGFVCHRWASLHQHGLFLACMTCFSSFAVILTNPIAAFISSTPELGWPWVYYSFALFSLLSFTLWLCLYSDQPTKHQCVGAHELKAILHEKTAAEIDIQHDMPYRAILCNKLIWVVWLNAFADIVTIVFLMTYLPTYVSKVLGYGVRETGIWSALGALAGVPVKIGSGWLADVLTCFDQVNGMRVFNSIALLASAVLFAIVGFVPDQYPFVAVLLLTLNIAVTGTNCGGFYKCATLVSRQYAHFVVAGIQFEKSVTLFVSPILFYFFINDESSREQWRTVFLGMAVVLTVANTCFIFTATDKPAEFTKKAPVTTTSRVESLKLK